MITQSPQSPLAGSQILEQLTLQLPNVERAAGRRAWHEAQAAWPGAESQLWWKWCSEATESIGLATKVIDCSSGEAVEMMINGAQLVCWTADNDDSQGRGCWISVRQINQKTFEVYRVVRDEPVTENVSLKQLKRVLADYLDDGKMRCVVVRSDISFGSHNTRGMKPLNRLIALLGPEWPDIWLILVFAFVTGLLMLATPMAVEALVNTVAFGRFLQPVVILAVILLMFLLFQAAMRALQTYVAELVQRRLFARVAGDLAYRLPRARQDSVDNVYLPELTNRFFDIVTVQKVAAQLLLDGLGLVLSAVIGMAVLAFYHPWLLGFDVVMMAAITFIILGLGRGAISSAVKESKNKYYMASWLEDISRCPTAFRTAGGADLAIDRTDRLVHEYLEARQSHFRILMRQILFALGLQAVASTVLLGLGGWLVISGQLTLGQLVAAEMIVTVVVGAFAKLGKHMESFYDLLASVDKLGVLFDLQTEHHDGVLEISAEGPAELRLDDVLYRGKSGGSLTTSVSAEVQPSTICAVLGDSGSGKTTLVDLISGQRAPTAGHITIDSFDPGDLRPDVLRDHMAVVRRGEIFHGTIEENVHLHRSSVTSVDVRHALESVGLYDVILRLPDGFDTRVNGNGSPLSESQADLLCLARAIAGQPRLLVIDGLMDCLPDDAVDEVFNMLIERRTDQTVLITTGRQSISDRCDQQISLLPDRPGGRFRTQEMAR